MFISVDTLRLLSQMGDSAASFILDMLSANPTCIAWANSRNPGVLEIRFGK